MVRFRLRTFLVAAPLIGMSPVVAEFLAQPFLATNCGGNSAALTACDAYVGTVQYWAEQHPGETFSSISRTPNFNTI